MKRFTPPSTRPRVVEPQPPTCSQRPPPGSRGSCSKLATAEAKPRLSAASTPPGDSPGGVEALPTDHDWIHVTGCHRTQARPAEVSKMFEGSVTRNMRGRLSAPRLDL